MTAIARDLCRQRHADQSRKPAKPADADFDALIRGQLDCDLVKVRGVVRTADIVVSNVSPVRSSRLQILTSGGIVHVSLDSNDAGPWRTCWMPRWT